VRIHAGVNAGLKFSFQNVIYGQFERHARQRPGIGGIAIDDGFGDDIRAFRVWRSQQNDYILRAMPLGNFLDFSLIVQINRPGRRSNKAARNGVHLNCAAGLRRLGDRAGLNRIPFSKSDDVLALQLHLRLLCTNLHSCSGVSEHRTDRAVYP
jgi:hypothetical protein